MTDRPASFEVHVPTPLRSYTAGQARVTASGGTLRELVADLDRSYPGIAFRMVDERGELRRHMVIWLNRERCRDLDRPIVPTDEVVLMQALSGG